jgi:putative flippase GtrA
MKNLFNKLKKIFFTRTFITFCIIGVINTAIHFVIYKLIYLYDVIVANTIAFICASIFSYLANAKFTFKEKAESKSFVYTMLTFVGRLLLSDLITYWFDLFFIKIELNKFRPVAPIIASAILIPFQFIFLKLIFKKHVFESDHLKK